MQIQEKDNLKFMIAKESKVLDLIEKISDQITDCFLFAILNPELKSIDPLFKFNG